MKKPDIGKRLIPLIDIVMLLLAFFIVLPHGIKSKEVQEKNAMQKNNEKLNREVSYYEWQYGKLKKLSDKTYIVLTLAVSSNDVYAGTEKIPEKAWEERLRTKIGSENINFVLIHVSDVAGKHTKHGTISKIEEILDNLQVVHIITYDVRK